MEVIAKIIANSPPAILMVIGGALALVNNPTWPWFLGFGVVLQALWLFLKAII